MSAHAAATTPPAHGREHEREQVAQFGMWVFIASEILFFGGLLFAYAIGRLHWPQGFAAAALHTDVVIGTVNTAVLLTSSLMMALAVTAAELGRPRLVAPFLWATLAFGLLFLVLKGVEYHHDISEGLVPGAGFRLGDAAAPVPAGAQMFFMLYWVLTVLHSVHLVIGIGLAGTFAWGAQRARPWVRTSRLQVTGLYWHFVDIVWIFLYPLLYLVQRHS